MDAARTSDADGELAVLRAAAALVAEEASPQVVWETAVEQVTGAVHADYLEILRTDPRDRIVVYAAWAAREGRIVDFDHRLLGENGLARQVMRTGRSVRQDLGSGQAPSAEAGAGGGVSITSSVGVPIVLGGQVWGAMFVHSTGAVPLPADTEERLTRFD